MSYAQCQATGRMADDTRAGLELSVACCAQTESGKYLISVRHLPGNDNAPDVCICSAG